MSGDTMAPQFFTIPKGTRQAQCRSCLAEIYWITTPRGKKMPVSVDADGAYCPTNTDDGAGPSHFVDCPNRDQYRSAR